MNTNPNQGIRDLILNKRGDRSLESLSKACGGIPTRANLDRLINRPVLSWPKENAVILGLAKGLGVRVIDVVVAYANSLGLPVQTDSSSLTLPGAGHLPEASQRIIRETADNMLWWQEQQEVAQAELEKSERNVSSLEKRLARYQQQAHPEAASGENVHELFPEDRVAADKGQPGVDPEQLPED